MKKIATIILLFVIHTISAQTNNKTEKQKITNENGEIQAEGILKNGKKEGTWIYYYEYTSKLVEKKENYKDDLKNGEWISYFMDGKIANKGIYKNDNLDGELISYNESGTIRSKEILANGLKNGICIYYDENGKIELKESYKNDLREGESIKYWAGKESLKGVYKQDKAEGKWIWYNEEDGSIQLTKTFKDGVELE